ncbi:MULTISPECIES: DUF4178 domain-containing protein [unclassified Nocardioides]|uniref:DUF4178 domain-containing protein n=1 Tax=unclassified Nocardioides TaxID=2615069 RepID=UPI0030150DEE
MPGPLVLLLVLLALAAAAVIGWWLVRRRDDAGPRRPDDVIGDVDKASIDQLKQLQVGDIIEFGIEKWFVRGSLHLDEHGYTWDEYMLDDADRKRWLGVEADEGFEVTLWEALAEGDIEQGSPGDRDVIVGAVAYRLQEQGEAAYTAAGSTGTAATGTMRYADYRAVDGRLLGFENFGSRWEASLGAVVQPWELTVFPSTDRKGTL